ncbi:hypothetical protein ES703_115306 [subsurface metagenome]
MQLDWHPWFTDGTGVGDSMGVISDPTTPGGDGWVGRISNEYMTMAGLTYSGTQDLTDYSIEAWIYTVVIAGMGPYNGIAIRMDTTADALYSLISDFDGDARLRLRLLESATPIVIRDWASGEIPGGVPTESSWHKFKLKMVADSIWCYYDDFLLPDCPFIHSSVAHGFFGVYTFNMDTASTRCDDIVVMDEGAGVAEHGIVAIESFTAYPNPFRDRINITYSKGQSAEGIELKIYDVSGRLVKDFSRLTLDAQRPTLLSWNGKDNTGNALAPGVYFISEKNSDILVKVVKLH